MSWRRFAVLVRCLSPASATVAKISSGQYIGSGSAAHGRAKTVAGPAAAEAAFQAQFKP
jgi:hypothetical protein